MFFNHEYNFISFRESEFDAHHSSIKIFENKMSQLYSLSNDSFKIDHGENYFSFFMRLGKVYYFLIRTKKDNNIVGTACGVLRDLQTKKFWYLCDLKIDIEHRGKQLTNKLFLQMFKTFFFKAQRGYLVSMDPESEQIKHIFEKISSVLHLNIDTKTKLLIYSLPVNKMVGAEKLLEKNFGLISYLSLKGSKDLVLSSTQKPIELYHLQHGQFAPKINVLSISELPADATVMFCLPNSSPLVKIMEDNNIITDISATIISYRMEFFDWHDILTSDI